MIRSLRWLPVLSLCLVAGCGYSVRTTLPAGIRTVVIENIENRIDITAEPTQQSAFTNYVPGLETDVTREIKDRFIYDGNLKVVNTAEEAALRLSGALISYSKEPIRYTDGEEVDGYRVKVAVNIKVENLTNGTTYWERNGVVGEDEYVTSGAHAKSEIQARTDAVKDLAKRVVERTVAWW